MRLHQTKYLIVVTTAAVMALISVSTSCGGDGADTDFERLVYLCDEVESAIYVVCPDVPEAGLPDYRTYVSHHICMDDCGRAAWEKINYDSWPWSGDRIQNACLGLAYHRMGYDSSYWASWYRSMITSCNL